MQRKFKIDFLEKVAEFRSAMRDKLLVRTTFYKRIFGGKGMEFDSFRRYSPGEDASRIDWKASVKSKIPLVREYIEERDLRVFFLIDVGDNMVFGSGDKLKMSFAGELVAAISHLILSSGDGIGYALYSENIKRMQGFGGGMKTFYGFMNDLQEIKNYGGKSDLKTALDFVAPRLKKASTVFIISDFLNCDQETLNTLKRFMQNYETIGIMVRDPVDNEMPNLDEEVIVEDIYTGEQMIVNPKLIEHEYGEKVDRQKELIGGVFTKSRGDLIELETNKDFVYLLAAFLKRRTKNRREII